MFRHISMYTLEENPAGGRTKAECLQTLKEMLDKLPETEPTIVNSVIGVGLGGPPGVPGFYDIAQIIDFASMEDCMAYPMTKGHGDLVEFGKGVIKDVAIIDFEF